MSNLQAVWERVSRAIPQLPKPSPGNFWTSQELMDAIKTATPEERKAWEVARGISN